MLPPPIQTVTCVLPTAIPTLAWALPWHRTLFWMSHWQSYLFCHDSLCRNCKGLRPGHQRCCCCLRRGMQWPHWCCICCTCCPPTPQGGLASTIFVNNGKFSELPPPPQRCWNPQWWVKKYPTREIHEYRAQHATHSCVEQRPQENCYSGSMCVPTWSDLAIRLSPPTP